MEVAMSISKEIESRIIRMKLTDGTQINGQVNIKRNPSYDRLSDLVATTREPFLVVFKATLYEAGLNIPVRLPTIFVNMQPIMWSTPDETQK